MTDGADLVLQVHFLKTHCLFSCDLTLSVMILLIVSNKLNWPMPKRLFFLIHTNQKSRSRAESGVIKMSTGLCLCFLALSHFLSQLHLLSVDFVFRQQKVAAEVLRLCPLVPENHILTPGACAGECQA